VAIVAALASDVELLILDEPTSGLDPLMENVFQEALGDARRRGASVLLSSHILTEVEALADRLSIIRDGEIVRTGTLGDLRGHTRTTIHAVLERLPGPGDTPDLGEVHLDGNRLSAAVDSTRIGAAMGVLTSYGITALTVEPPSLESLFLRLYDGDGDGDGDAGTTP
jgi:ABC-2 type transport system ATP-binding protein